jgi:uncharacterized tellurite resistance protein B-like protein
MTRGWDVLRWLGLEPSSDVPEVLDSVSRLLDRLDDRRARYVAAFAYLLGRVARADMHIAPSEMAIMTRLILEEAELSPEEAEAVVTLALGEVTRFGGTHNYLVTREFAEHATDQQRLGLLRCLFALAAADESVATLEDNEIRGISRELAIEHGDFVRARMEVREHLAVLRRQSAGS